MIGGLHEDCPPAAPTMPSANSLALKGTRSSIFSPTPTYRMGILRRVRYGEHEAALCRAVELRDHDAADGEGLVESFRLGDDVLPVRRVYDEERLVGGAWQLPADDPLYLFHLLHQVDLRVKAPGRIEYEDVRASRLRGPCGVVGDRGRVGILPVLYGLDAEPLPPYLELLYGGGPERVAGAQQRPTSSRRGISCASFAMVVVLPTPLTPRVKITKGAAPFVRGAFQRAGEASLSRRPGPP